MSSIDKLTDKLASVTRRLGDIMRNLRDSEDRRIRQEVEDYRLEIEEVRQFAGDAIVARSSELLRTASHREFMERLPARAELKDKEDEVRVEAARVSASYESIVSYAQLLDQRHRDRLQFGLSLALGLLAVMSLFSLFGFVDLDVNRRAHPTFPYVLVELIAAGIFVGLVIVLTWTLRPSNRSQRQKRSEKELVVRASSGRYDEPGFPHSRSEPTGPVQGASP